jgi:transposase
VDDPKNAIRGPGGTLPLRNEDEAARDLHMLIEGETSGRPLDDVLAAFGRSRSTYYEKLRRFREQGLEGLIAKPPGPRTAWRRPLEVVRYIVRARLRDMARSAADIAEELDRLGHSVSIRTVERTLTQFGLTRGAGSAAQGPVAVTAAATPAPEAIAERAAVAPSGRGESRDE